MANYGKGSKDRVSNIKLFKDNFEEIDWSVKSESIKSLEKASKEFCELNGDALFQAASSVDREGGKSLV